jgi:hypothetical protein
MKEELHHHIDGETCAHHGCSPAHQQIPAYGPDTITRLRMTKSKPKIDRKATKAKRKQKHR